MNGSRSESRAYTMEDAGRHQSHAATIAIGDWLLENSAEYAACVEPKAGYVNFKGRPVGTGPEVASGFTHSPMSPAVRSAASIGRILALKDGRARAPEMTFEEKPYMKPPMHIINVTYGKTEV